MDFLLSLIISGELSIEECVEIVNELIELQIRMEIINDRRN